MGCLDSLDELVWYCGVEVIQYEDSFFVGCYPPNNKMYGLLMAQGTPSLVVPYCRGAAVHLSDTEK